MSFLSKMLISAPVNVLNNASYASLELSISGTTDKITVRGMYDFDNSANSYNRCSASSLPMARCGTCLRSLPKPNWAPAWRTTCAVRWTVNCGPNTLRLQPQVLRGTQQFFNRERGAG